MSSRLKRGPRRSKRCRRHLLLERYESRLLLAAHVVNRQLFYDNSAFDSIGDHNAIAQQVKPLLSGQNSAFASPATSANFSNYVFGVNGLVVDVLDLAQPSMVDDSDFAIRIGNQNDLQTWTTGPSPTVSVDEGAGHGGADRIYLTWPDGSLQNTWVEITVDSNARTGLSSHDMFYVGNAVGDADRNGLVNGIDFGGPRDNGKMNATIGNHYDFNRDGYVDGADMAIARDYVTDLTTSLTLLTSPIISASLENDTAPFSRTNNDGVTNDPVIRGNVSNGNVGVALLEARVDGGGDATVSIDAQGNFTFDPALSVDGTDDGSHSVLFTATANDGLIGTQTVDVTLDTIAPNAPTFMLHPASDTDPDGDNATKEQIISLQGLSDANSYLQVSQSSTRVLADGAGQFQIHGVPLSLGTHVLTVEAYDLAGNSAATDQSLTRDPAADAAVLAEESDYATEQSVLVDLGQMEGKRTIRFDIESDFDTTDLTAAVEDTFLVYLVSPGDPSQTLLDRGEAGTALFSLSGSHAEFLPGLVRYNGLSVEIDVTSLGQLTEGRLLFQLINNDSDTGTQIAITNIVSEVAVAGVESPVFPRNLDLVDAGDPLDTSSLTVSTDIQVELENRRLDSASGRYTAELRVQNNGLPTGRTMAVVLPGLPAGVTVPNATGTTAAGDPYLNLTPAIPFGGLNANATSQSTVLELDNPSLTQFSLITQVRVGPPNAPPVFDSIGTLSVMPGATLTVPLSATDTDGDPVAFSIDTSVPLPNLTLATDKLIIEPAPDQVGQYQLQITATDGAGTDQQTAMLDVVLDAITTTRISGRVQNTDEQPLENIVLQLGRFQTATAADGSYTIEIPSFVAPTESFDIPVPFGDAYFDPFNTGIQTIELHRAG